MYTAADVQRDGLGAVMDERARELYGEEYRHDEMMRWSVIYAKTGKPYKGKTYSISGNDIEKSLSANSFYYDRMMEKNNFFREQVPWKTYPDVKYRIEPKHCWWPVYEPFLIGNVGAVFYLTLYSIVSTQVFFYAIAVTAIVGFIALLLMEEPKGHIAEVDEDGKVTLINVS